MLPASYEALFNKALDVTAIVDIPAKLFALFVIVRYSPKDMWNLAMFLLTYMSWNLAGNTILAFVHVYALFPAECFRLDGLLSGLTDHPVFGYSVFYVLLFCIMNAGLVGTLTFPYRYMVFAHPTVKVKPIYMFGLYSAVNICVAIFFAFLYIFWSVPYDDYPVKEDLLDRKEDLLDRKSVICFKPSGWEKDFMFVCLISSVMGMVFIGASSTILLTWSIHNKKGQMHEKLLAQHKKILFTLIIITGIPLLFGGVPFAMIAIYVYEPRLPYAAEMCMLSIVMIANHGTINAIAVVVVVKPYRQAVRNIIVQRLNVVAVHNQS
uniref:G_PROTEIN_RECEP_F1_2 domain-containing protein n=1 Tax=Steinernema glaseri TaxID=37863 RepID=A0A1I7XZG8_9BILA